jgi:hypothetical protein
MLKRLTRKLFTVVVLCAALTTVSYAPASSTNRQMFCFDGPITNECDCGYYCCDRFGNCTCRC